MTNTVEQTSNGADDLHAGVVESATQLLRSLLPAAAPLSSGASLAELGLSSLAAVRLRLELQRRFGADLSLEELASARGAAPLSLAITQRASKAERSRLYQDGANAGSVGADALGSSEPFELTEIQQAYLMGKESALEGDANGCNLYREIRIAQLDVGRLRAAWQRLVDHHDMLRVELTEDGRQRVRAECRDWAMPIHRAEGGEGGFERTLERVRAAASRRGFRKDEWPLFRLEVSENPEGTSVVHFNIDGAVCDGAGLSLLLEGWSALYEDASRTLPRSACSVQAALAELSARRGSREYEQDLEYWVTRLGACPKGPALVKRDRTGSEEAGPIRSRPLSGGLSAAEWGRFRARAEALGVTPTALALTVFAEELGRAGDARPFSLVLTTNHRPWLEHDVQSLVGPFTGTMIFPIEWALDGNLSENARKIHKRLFQDLEHAAVDSVAAVRELRRRKKPVPSELTVVFTSLLDVRRGQATSSFADSVSYALSQTSGIRLDNQIWEQDGGLRVHWDVAEGAFDAGAVDALFCCFLRSLRACADSAHEAPDVRPLNELQKAYFVARAGGGQAHDGCQVYQSFVVRDLDPRRLERALLRMIEAYDVLRTVIGSDGSAHVLASSPSRFEIPVIDWTRVPDQSAVQAELCHAMVARAYPLGRWPMFDVRVTQEGTRESRVHVCIDLAIADGMSLHFLTRELLRLAAGEEPSAEPRVAAAVTEAELRAVSSIQPEAAEAWRRRFEGMPPGPPLARDPVRRDRIRLRATLPTWQSLKHAAAERKIEPDTLVAAALSAALQTFYPGRAFSIPVVQWPTAAAAYRPCELTALTWVTDLGQAETLFERAERYSRQIARDPPREAGSGLAELRRHIMQQRRHGEFALPVVYTSTLDLTGWPLPPGVEAGPWMTYTPDVSLDCISVEAAPGVLELIWDAVEADFAPGQLQAMFSEYEGSLHALAKSLVRAEPARSEGAQVSRETMLYEWNATARPFPDTLLCHQPFEEYARKQANAPSLRSAEGDLSYAELNRCANRIAWRLKAEGTRAEVIVGVAVGRGLAMVAAVLGVLKAGGAYLPIDVAWPAERMRTVLGEAQAVLVLAERDVAARMANGAQEPWRTIVIEREPERVFPQERSDDPPAAAEVGNTAYVIFTSGSTGTPKGIAVAHRSVVNLLSWAYRTFQFGPRDRGLAVAALGFDLSVFDIFGLLGCGASLYVANEEQQKDPNLLLDLLLDEGITFWNSAPAVLHQMAAFFPPARGRQGTTALRLVFLSGDYTPLSLPDDLRATFSNALVVNLGGATEATVWSNYYVVGVVDPSWRSIPYGKPIDNCRYYVLDEKLEPVGVDVEGDLYIAGVPLSLGYLNRPELTRENFIADPFVGAAGERMYRTGDRACYRADGNLVFLGRRDQQVKIRGFRVELAEIEHRVRAFPGIKDALVAVRRDNAGDQKVVAYAIVARDAAPNAKQLRAFVAEALPAYMVPNHVAFLAEFPKTANGKVDRAALPWPLSDAPSAAPPAADHAPARDEIAAVVTKLCAEAIGRASVDADQDLWELGATSFNMVQVSGGLQRRFGCRVPVAALVEEATVRSIARFLEKQLHGAAVPAPERALSVPEPAPAEPAADASVDLFDGASVKRFKREARHLRADKREHTIALGDVRPRDEHVRARGTQRRFGSGPVALEKLSRLLGMLRDSGEPGEPRHLYASAGSTYAVQVYVHAKAGGVDGLDAGVYYYHPREHALKRVSAGSALERTIHFQYNRPIYDAAAAGIFLIGQMSAIRPLYGDDAERFLLLEAGYMGQLLTMAQHEAEIGLCPIGSLAFERVRDDFALDEGQRFLHAFLAGALESALPRAGVAPFFGQALESTAESAIVGIAGRYPGADSPRALWRLLRAGERAIGPANPERPELAGNAGSQSRTVFGGFIRDVASFDSLLFRVSPREAKELDPQIRLALEVVWECLEDAGYTAAALNARGRVGVFAAVMWHDYQQLGADLWSRGGDGTVGGHASDLANRISYVFGFAGPSVAVNTSCSSALTALHGARSSLESGECDAAVVVAVNLVAHPFHLGALAGHGLLASTPSAVAFDPESAGWIPGEGCGALLLRRADSAARDGDALRAIVESTAIAHSAGGRRFIAADAGALARSMERALQGAAIAPEAIDYVECAAAGAPLADAAEIEALEQVFGKEPGTELRIGSLKPNIGHLEAAAGMSQLTKVLAQLHARELAPTLVADKENPLVPWSRLHLRPVRRREPWSEGASGRPRRALVNAMGATGSYAHTVLREARVEQRAATTPGRSELVILSAASREQLKEQAVRLRDFLARPDENGPVPALADVAFTLQLGRVAMEHRLVVDCDGVGELIAALDAFVGGRTTPRLRAREVEAVGGPLVAPPTLALAAEQWLAGHGVDWSRYWDGRARRTPLPTYPFARERHWLDLPAESQQGSGSAPARSSQNNRAEHYLIGLYAEVSGIPRSKLRARTPLEQYGLNSALIGELNARLERDLGDVPRTLFFEHGDLASVARFLESRFDVPVAPNAASSGALPASVEIAAQQERVAIIGIAGRYPHARNVDELWQMLLEGRDCIRQLPEQRRRPGWPVERMWGSFLDEVAGFDPLFFQILPRDAELMSPEERLFLEVAWETVEDAGYGRKRLRDQHRSRCGVFVGAMYNEYQFFGVEQTLAGRPSYSGSSMAGIANRVSYFLDAHGPSMTVDTMCSASLTALHLAVESLLRGECELALAGGVNLCLHPNKFIQIDSLKMSSSDHRCRAFGAGGDGFVPGEGVGAVLLKPLSRALADGDRIHCVVVGTAVNHGGRTNGYMVPNPDSQAEVIRAALHRHGVAPSSIGYVEAHGTGTALGDPIEIEGLSRAFADGAAPLSPGSIAIGSLKSVLGHLEAAAGIAGVTKVIQQMKAGRLAPSIHAERLNPNVDWTRSPFRVQRDSAEWVARRSETGAALPRRAAVSSFGAGGSNAHVVLEAFEEPARVVRTPAVAGARELIVLSARDRARLLDLARRYCDAARADDRAPLEDIAHTVQVGRDALPERLAVVVTSHEELVRALEGFVRGEPGPCVFGRALDDPPTGPEPGSLEALARHWVSGGAVDWRARRAPGTARITRLPSYPFAEMRCWVPEARREPAVTAALYERTWRATEPSPATAPAIGGGAVCIFGEQSQPVARALAEAFGPNRIVLARAGEPVDARAADALVWIDLCDLFSRQSDRESWRTRLEALQRWLSQHGRRERRVLHLTSGLYDGRGAAVPGARLAAIVRVLDAELGQLSARTMDTDLAAERPVAIADQISAELGTLDPTGEVRYRAGRRYIPELRRVDEAPLEPVVLAADRAYIVTGGTRGLGAKVAHHLVQRGARKLALWCAGPVPERAQWDRHLALPEAAKHAIETARELERRGAEVRIFAGASSTAESVRDGVRQVRSALGPIGGVVHCAGRPSQGSRAFLRKNSDEIASVFAAKADLLEALAAECRADPLAFFVTFSSVSAVVPALAVGVLDYAAANAFMDIFAAQRAAAGDGPYRSIAWPAWTDSSASAEALAACKRVGIAPLETNHALAALDRVLGGGLPSNLLVVPPGSAELDIDALLRNGRRVSTATEVCVAPAATGTRPPAWLWELFSRELGIPVDDLDARTSFTDLGVESVMLGELVRKIEESIRRPLEPSVLIEHCTLERLSARLGELGVPSELDHESASNTADSSGPPPVTGRAEPAPDGTAPAAGSGFASAAESASLRDAIAVIGLGARFPGAPCADEFWNNLLAGECSISEVPRERWDTKALYDTTHVLGKSISKWGGFVEGLADFDPDYFGMTQEEAARCDPAIRLFLECAASCLADAGYPTSEVSGSRTGVFVGTRLSGYRRRLPLGTGAARLGGDQNFVAARVAHFLDLHGPNLVTDSACSSALVAVKLACQSLLQGESELAFAGAVDILLDEEPYLEFSAARALSPSGRCRTFDRAADGFVPGEGCGVLLLKPLANALRDGDRVRAVIRAVAVNNDGATMGLTTPNPTAQTDVVRRALDASGVEPAAIGMIEAHGTATMIGDPIELRALTDAFGAVCGPGSCAIGSVKSNIGHLMSAAGIAGLIKAILSVERGKIPPTLFCDVPNPRFDFAASPFFPNERVRDWPLDPGARIAGVSAFGLGGTNAHAIISGLPSELRAAEARVRAPLPAPKFHRQRCWIDRPDVPVALPPAPRAEEVRPRRFEASILELEFVT